MAEMAKANQINPLVTKIHVPADLMTDRFVPALINLMMAGTEAPGCWSAEIIAPHHPGGGDWLVVQRYRSLQQTEDWKQSPVRAKLLEEIGKLKEHSGVTLIDDAPDLVAQNSIATAITTSVKHGMHDRYRSWETRAQVAQANFPGYHGAFVQPPVSAHHDQWTTVVRFDSPATLEKWFACQERTALLPEANDFVKATAIKSLTNSFPGWVPTDESGKEPHNWQTCLLVLLGLFPIVMLEIKFLAPQLRMFNPAVANFLSLAISCFCVSYVTMKILVKQFRWWLFPEDNAPPSTMAKGILIISALAAIEVSLFRNLLP